MTDKPMLSVERELIQRIADHCKFWIGHTYLEAIADVEVELRALLDEPAVDTDVRKILLAVVPGADGEGEEVYAETVADVEVLLSTQAECIDDLEAQLADLRATQAIRDTCPNCAGLERNVPCPACQPVAVVELRKAASDPVYVKRGVLTDTAYDKVEPGTKLYAAPQPARHTMRSVARAYLSAREVHLPGSSNFCAFMADKLNEQAPGDV